MSFRGSSSWRPGWCRQPLVSPTILTYQDVDGDAVTVRFSKPLLNSVNVAGVFGFDSGSVTGNNSAPQQLRTINLTKLSPGAPVGGLSITVTAVRSAVRGGDGFVNVGFISGGSANLGDVTVRGDLGGIVAGDGTSATLGLQSLTVQSLGRFGLSTQGGVGSLTSGIEGHLGTLTVKSDIVGATVQAFGPGGASTVLGPIGSIAIGDSLFGGSGANSGSISAGGDIGPVTIKGDVVGGAGADSGEIKSGGKIGAVTVGEKGQGNRLNGPTIPLLNPFGAVQ